MRTGKEVVDFHTDRRSWLAKKIVKLRQEARRDFPELKANSLVRLALNKELKYKPFKPTVENFIYTATRMLAYSRTPIPYCGTEHYSCCGMEDYYGELRNSARTDAIEFFRAWKYMRNRSARW